MTYSIVIATRNRSKALKLSIPRMVSQTRPPSQIIIVDSSDNHEEVVSTVKGLNIPKSIELVVKNAPPSSSQQRNMGVEFVKNPIVFFPDDDSIWFEDTAEQQMRIYESENGNLLAAVCAAESTQAPPGFLEEGVNSYKMTYSDRIRQKINSRRAKLEKALFPDPFLILARRFYPDYSLEEKFSGMDISPVEYMTGFRMGFRTDVVKEGRFETTFERYCLNEDVDASLFAWTKGLVVAAKRSKVFHYKAPGQRANGWNYGVDSILNKAFIISKYTEVDDGIRKYCLRYFKYKCFLYSMATKGEFGKDRASGAKEATQVVNSLLRVEPERVREEYKKIKKQLEFNRSLKL